MGVKVISWEQIEEFKDCREGTSRRGVGRKCKAQDRPCMQVLPENQSKEFRDLSSKKSELQMLEKQETC